MADITNPESVRYSDIHVRTLANRMAQLYYASKTAVDEWFANGAQVLIPNEPGDTIIDGLDKPISGANANSIIERATEIIADFEASDKAKLTTILAVAMNSTPS